MNMFEPYSHVSSKHYEFIHHEIVLTLRLNGELTHSQQQNLIVLSVFIKSTDEMAELMSKTRTALNLKVQIFVSLVVVGTCCSKTLSNIQVGLWYASVEWSVRNYVGGRK